MAPISLDPNADTVIRVIQRGPVKLKQIEFKVLTAAISASPYWKAFTRHMDGTSGFKPNMTHIEDTGITVTAVEIVLRGLHQAYHHRKSGSGDSNNEGDEINVEGKVGSNESANTSGAGDEQNGALGFDGLSLTDKAPANVNSSDKVKRALPIDGGATLPVGPPDVDVYFPKELSEADIDDVWGVLALVNLKIAGEKHKGKLDVDWTVVRPWFFKWRKTNFATFNTQAAFEKVLLPTFAFDDEIGFLQATKWLCLRTSVGNINEYSPLVFSQGTTWYLHLHLPKGVMCKFPCSLKLPSPYTDSEAAHIRVERSRHRARVSNQVWSIIRGPGGWLLNSDKCTCWIVAHYNYIESLEEAGVLCPELDHKKTIMELVKRMQTVEYEEPLHACMRCSNANIASHLKSAIQIGSSFPGVSIAKSLERDGGKGLPLEAA